jgi:hypothetical protein
VGSCRFGPKTLRLAGELVDGVILDAVTTPDPAPLLRALGGLR